MTSTQLLSDADLPAPPGARYFEHYVPGSTYEFGHVGVSEEEIVEFARRWDPQTIHDDPELAAVGPFGGLIASGVQTLALTMRMYVDHYVSHVASLASPGIDELRWPRPVRPGDTLRLRVAVQAARVSRTKPDRGLVHTAVTTLNQDDDPVMTFTAMNLFGRRPEA